MNVNAPVGVFDSGVGGLTVAREIMRQAPEESLVYFGDTARVPYGSKSRDTPIVCPQYIETLDTVYHKRRGNRPGGAAPSPGTLLSFVPST